MSSSTHDATWFRLAVRGIGVLLVAWGAPSLVSGALQVLQFMFRQPGMSTYGFDWTWLLPLIGGPLVQVIIGVYLLIGARGLITYCCRGALGMCPACNYDVRDVPGSTCPECGVALPGRTPPPEG
jgi:hypothetical protein